MKRNRTILHVDDDQDVLRLISKRLGDRGFEVASLADPMLTSPTLLATGARLVLLDIDMPQIDGLSVLKKIKCQDGGVQVIMLTGLASQSTVLQSMRWGAEACVFKPLTDAELLYAAVGSAFEKIDRWWCTLKDLRQRKSREQRAVAAGIHLT